MVRIGKLSREWWCVTIVAMAAVNCMQASADDGVRIPKAGQPTSDFYNAAGTGVRLTAEATPTELTRGDWLTLRLTATNLINAAEVVKPSLKTLPEFAFFQVEEGAELDSKSDPANRGSRVFVYRVRPHSEQVTQIPEVAFYYFDPRRIVAPNRPRDRFPKTYSNAIAIRVMPPIELPVAAPVPLDVPSFAKHIASGNEILTTQSTRPPIWIWLIAAFVPPLLAIGWIVAWRKLYPDAAKLVFLKRIRAVRVALAALARAKNQPPVEAADTVAFTMLDYLRDRYLLPPGSFTPAEIAAHLRSTGCPAERIERVEALFRQCDNCRFAPRHDLINEMAVDADQLIITMEEPA